MRTRGGLVIFPSVANGRIYIGGYNKCYALDAKTGTLVWNQGIGDGFAWTYPAVANGVVYVTTTEDLIALSEETGR